MAPPKAPGLESLGLDERTVLTRVYCFTPDMTRHLGWIALAFSHQQTQAFCNCCNLYFQQQDEGAAGSSCWDSNFRKGSGVWGPQLPTGAMTALQLSGQRSLTTLWNSSHGLDTDICLQLFTVLCDSIAFLPILRYRVLEQFGCCTIFVALMPSTASSNHLLFVLLARPGPLIKKIKSNQGWGCRVLI